MTTRSKPVEEPAARRKLRRLKARLSRLQAEQSALRESEARFRILSELISDCCWARWTSRDGSTSRVWVNDTFEQLTGYSPEEFGRIGREGLVHPEDLEQALRFVDGPMGVSEHEFRIRRKDGEVRWLHERMWAGHLGDELCVLGATQDITERKRAEAVLEESHRLLEQQVEERTAELRRANRQLEEEIEEHRRTQEELRRARDAAEAASVAKSQFLANMSHEMRTPLHGIIGISELILDTDLQASSRGHLELLKDSAQALLGLIDGVLDFSKIEAGKLSLEIVEFRVLDVEIALRRMFAQAAERRGNVLRIEIARGLPETLRGDPSRLRQIFVNLLTNAVKFTRDGTIEVTAEPVHEDRETVRLRFEVRDTGIGIEKQAQAELFAPFTQADSSTTRRFGGTGLGLAICKRLVEVMDGEIGVDSAPGRGSRFWFTAGFGRAVPGTGDADATAPPPPPAGRSYRVLVAEDNPVNQLVTLEQLRLLGHRADVVANGHEAEEALVRERYDVVLMDCHMPELDGYETTRRIRRRERGRPARRLPVVAITASANTADLERCYEVGMDAHLTKPFRGSDLAAVLERLLEADGSPRAPC